MLESLGNERESSFLKPTPSGDPDVQLMLRTEVPREDIHVLTRLILWHEFGLISRPSLLAHGSVSLAETVQDHEHTCFPGPQPGFTCQVCVTWGHVGAFWSMDVSSGDTYHSLVFLRPR